jgi:hypothetical protein
MMGVWAVVIGSVPAVVRDVANGAKDLCTRTFRYSDLVLFLCALFFGLPTFSSIARSFVFSLSVSALSRKVRAIPHESIVRRNRNRIARMIHEVPGAASRFVLILDDTLVRHYGKSPDNCYWFDHTNNCTTRGRNYLVIVVLDTYTGQTFPLSAVLLRGKKHPKYRPRSNIVRWQLRIVKALRLHHLTVTADSWFADRKIFEWLQANGFDFEIEMKGNRKVTYLDKRPQGLVGKRTKIVYPKLSDVAANLKRNTAYSGGAPKQVAGGVVRFFGSDLRLRFCAVWNQNDTAESQPFAYYVTNNTSRPASRIWALSRFRWAIECHFRRSKQDFAFDTFPIHDAIAAHKLIILGMFLITTLELSRHDPAARPAGKQEIRRRFEPLSSWVKRERQMAQERTLHHAFQFPSRHRELKAHLKGRMSPNCAVRKPRETSKAIKIIAATA